jgi:addiction module RelE/StbE family toxin
MKYRVRTLETGYEDLKEIKKYLAQFYPSTVKKFVDLFKKQRDRLKDFPFSCPVYADVPDYRCLIVGDYLAFYIVDEERKTDEIHRVFHGSRDIQRYLKQDLFKLIDEGIEEMNNGETQPFEDAMQDIRSKLEKNDL